MENYFQPTQKGNDGTKTETANANTSTAVVVAAEKKPFSEIQVTIPSWLEHKGGVSITTLDVSLDGTHVATGGADNFCRIWDFRDICAEAEASAGASSGAAATSAAQPRRQQPLGLAMFACPVSCVRWNPKIADVLAVATDDSKVAILKRISSVMNGNPRFTIFGVEGKFYENYQTLHTFTISSTEVPDIAWSPDGKRIASCSLEGIVSIHNVEAKQLLKSITFDGPVKGLSWDPLDRYIAAQSEDSTRSLGIITVPDYEIQQKISENGMFDKNSCLFFRRLAWSPDGSLLGVCPTLYHSAEADVGKAKGAVMQSATFLRRSDFTFYDCAPGPSKEINVLRFSRGFYAPGKNEDKVYFPCAMSSLDRLITVRIKTPKKDRSAREPAVEEKEDEVDDEEADFDDGTECLVLRDVCESSVNDLAWTPDGFGLLAATDSGKIIYIKFDSALLGTPCTEEEFAAHLERTHGKKLNYRPPAAFYDVLETPLQLELEKKASAVSDPYSVHVPTAEEEEIEASKHSEQKVSTKKGRLRITPKLITTAQFNKMISSDSPGSSSSSLSSSKPDSTVPSSTTTSTTTTTTTPVTTTTTLPSSTATTSSNPVITIDDDEAHSSSGPNEIPAQKQDKKPESNASEQPHKTSPSSTTPTPIPKTTKEVPNEQPSKGIESSKKDLLNKLMDRHTDASSSSQVGSLSLAMPAPPSSQVAGTDQNKLVRTTSATKRLNGWLEEGAASSASSQPKSKRRKEDGAEAGEALLVGPVTTSAAPITLHNPDNVLRCVFAVPGREAAEVEARAMGNDAAALTRVQLQCGEVSWATVIRGAARVVTLNSVFCAVGCTDSSLTVLDFRSGRSLLPKIGLGNGGVPMLLKANATRHLAVVTNTCELSVFDVAARRAIVSRVLVDPGLLRSETDATLAVTPAGVAVLTFSDAQVAYDAALGAWVHVARKLRASALERPRDKAADHALALWEAEQELALADLLEDRGEYETALFRYAHLLSDGADEARLRILLDDVLHAKAMERVCGLMKCTRQDLLRKLLVIAAKNRKLQRLCEEFYASLKEPVSEKDSDDQWKVLV